MCKVQKKTYKPTPSKQRDAVPGWASIVVGGPALAQHRDNDSCLGIHDILLISKKLNKVISFRQESTRIDVHIISHYWISALNWEIVLYLGAVILQITNSFVFYLTTQP